MQKDSKMNAHKKNIHDALQMSEIIKRENKYLAISKVFNLNPKRCRERILIL